MNNIISIPFTCENGYQESIIKILYAGIHQIKVDLDESQSVYNEILLAIEKGDVFLPGDYRRDRIHSLAFMEREKIQTRAAQQNPHLYDANILPHLNALLSLEEKCKKGDLQIPGHFKATIGYLFDKERTHFQRSMYTIGIFIHNLTLSETQP